MSGRTLPSTFEARGLSLPLTTPLLAFARMRKLPAGPVMLLPSLHQAGCRYCLPFDQLSRFFNLSVADRALLEGLAKLDQPDPAAIRTKCHKLGLTGLAGAKAMRRAQEDAARLNEHGDPPRILPDLLKAAAEQLTDMETDNQDFRTPEALAAFQEAVVPYSQSAAIGIPDILKHLEDWSCLADPALAAPGVQAPEKRIAQLLAFSEDLRRWLIHEPIEPAEQAQRTSLAIQHSLKPMQEQLKNLNRLTRTLSSGLTDWDNTWQSLTEAAARLDQLLDGWDIILARWRQAEQEEYYIRRITLSEFIPHLPLLPEEPAAENLDFWQSLAERQFKWSQQNPAFLVLPEQTRHGLAALQEAMA